MLEPMILEILELIAKKIDIVKISQVSNFFLR